MEISIIGVGRLGGALALALSEKNYTIRQLVSHKKDVSRIANLISLSPEILSSKNLETLSPDVIFITTPDSEIQVLAELLARKLKNTPIVFHTSGALSSEILRSLKEIGCETGSLHPLVSVSDAIAGSKSFKDVFFCVEGTPATVTIAEKIVADLEGKAFTVPTEFKALYHASAVMASGHLVALFSVAAEMLVTCGLSETEAQKVLLPLVESTINNLKTQSFAKALTGPFARADVKTLQLHLEALSERALPQTIEIYRQLGEQSLHLAERQGAEKQRLDEMRKYLAEPKNKKNES